jgi:undecaprenyl diphosphate synthase
MDGNRRWAKKKGLPVVMGHRKGAETLEQVCRDAKDLGLKYLTLYTFSTENWHRSAEEVASLMDLLREYLKNDLKEIQKNKVRIVFIGERKMLDVDIAESMKRIEVQTAKNTDLILCLAISYGSRQEILNAVKQAAKLIKTGEIELGDLDEHLFSNLLYTKGIPDPDLVVRTSGEQRISNYLLWQIAYSEFCFTNVLWPDFNKKELEKIINDFNNRERRYGKE